MLISEFRILLFFLQTVFFSLKKQSFTGYINAPCEPLVWKSVLEFTYSNGETKNVDLTKLAVRKKRVRPLEKQDPFESRYVIHASIQERGTLDLNLILFTNWQPLANHLTNSY